MYSCSYITKETSALLPLLPHENVVEAFLENCCPYFHLFGGSLYLVDWNRLLDYWNEPILDSSKMLSSV